MTGTQQLPGGDAAPQPTTTLPRRSRRSSPSLPNGESAAVKPAAAATATAQEDQTMDEASDAESDSSVVSTSSEEPSSESDEDSEDDEEDTPMDTDEVTSLPLPPDAETRRKIYQRQAPPASSLSERLKAFLPQMAAANVELEKDRAAGKLAQMSLENVGEDDEHYIEMNLGLGVLKEKNPNKTDSDSEMEEDSDDEMDTAADDQKTREENILGKLMGKKKTKTGPGIQEVPDQ